MVGTGSQAASWTGHAGCGKGGARSSRLPTSRCAVAQRRGKIFTLDAFRRSAQPSALLWRSLAGWAGLMLCAVAAMGAVVWLLSGRPWDRSLARLVDAGVIRIGYANEAPYAFLRPDGEISGHTPELARRIVERLGIRQVEWRVTDFGSLIAELEDGHIDVIAAGMFITQERARRVQFSEPIFHVEQALLVAKGNPKGLHSYADALNRPDVKIAVLSGAVEAEMLQRLGVPEAQLVLLPDAATGRVAVEAGLADGLALSSPTIEWMVRHDHAGKTERAAPFTQTIPEQESGQGYGAFAFRKEDRALLDAWNAAQGELLSGREFQMLIEEFGFSRNELPGPARTREILAR